MLKETLMRTSEFKIGVGVVCALVIAAAWLMLYPQYRVYLQNLDGRVALSQAESARQVLLLQAQAEKDAALLKAQAIEIVGEAAKNFPDYRQQEFIGAFAEAMHNGKISQIIYVPTESSIPVLEAGKRSK